MENKTLGLIISEVRKELGLSLDDIADRTGLHRTTIGLIERGEREPTIKTASLIAEAINKNLPELLLLEESSIDTATISKMRTANPEYIRNEEALESVGLSAEILLEAIEHCYNTLDIIDAQLINNGTEKLSKLVELANLSAIIGNVLGAGVADSSDGVFIRNRPHAYPDLIRTNGTDEGIEIKIALETNKPKGHLPKEGYYLTFRYVLTDSEGIYNKLERGDTVSIWEVKCDYLSLDDFSISNTSGDSGKTAPITTGAHNRMNLVYLNPNIVPYVHSESKSYPGFN